VFPYGPETGPPFKIWTVVSLEGSLPGYRACGLRNDSCLLCRGLRLTGEGVVFGRRIGKTRSKTMLRIAVAGCDCWGLKHVRVLHSTYRVG
jgi:hypothetical protein